MSLSPLPPGSSQVLPYGIVLVLKLFPVLFAVVMKSLYGKSPVTCLWPVQIHYFSWGPLPPCSQAGCAAGFYAVFSSLQVNPQQQSHRRPGCLFCPQERMTGLSRPLRTPS